MARIRRRRTTFLRQLVRDGQRCPARHPNWHGARCEQRHNAHVVHSAEDGNFVWVDERTALLEVVGHD